MIIPPITIAKKIPTVEEHSVIIIPLVPFFSQFKDITSPKWQKVGCGVASLAMIINFYKNDTVSVDTLLEQGISSGAYLEKAGWTHAGLISLSKKYGLSGESYDFAKLSKTEALKKLQQDLIDGPVMASVHYKFDPKNPIPHLVVIDGIDGDTVYYNDPASTVGQKTIPVSKFLASWKNRYIVIRPNTENNRPV